MSRSHVRHFGFSGNTRQNIKANRQSIFRATLTMALMLSMINSSTSLRADSGSCGGATITVPFTDVMGNTFFCQIAEAFFSGLTNGTTATTYGPADNVPREQMAAFITRTLDQSLKRGSDRAVLKHFWTPTGVGLGITPVGPNPQLVESDGADLWVSNSGNGTVSRVSASDGKLLSTFTGAPGATGVLVAKGSIFLTAPTSPGTLYQISAPFSQGPVTVLSANLGNAPFGIAFDGLRIWTANNLGSISMYTFNPPEVTTITTGFSSPFGILYDGANIWVTDSGTTPGKLLKLDSTGSIIQTITVGNGPRLPVFDGTNIWVPNSSSNTLTVVRASTGAVLATLSANGLQSPFCAAFDGERILVTDASSGSVSLWKATDLTPLGSVVVGTFPFGACSDGDNFWIVLNNTGQLARF